TRVSGATPDGVSGQLAASEMSIHPREHAVWSDKDFFYVVRNEIELPTGGEGDDWSPSPGPQPPPSSWPALWSGRAQLGTLAVELLRIEPGRTNYAVTASALEPMTLGQAAPRRRLAPEQFESAVLAVSFGHTTSRTRYGMVFGNRVTLPLRPGYGNLIVKADGELAVVGAHPNLEVDAKATVVQLPELVSEGIVTAQASLRGGRRLRGGICVIDGRV